MNSKRWVFGIRVWKRSPGGWWARTNQKEHNVADYNFRVEQVNNMWVPVMYAGAKPWVTIRYEGPAAWTAKSFKVFQVDPSHTPSGSTKTAKAVHDEIMQNNDIVQYNDWKNSYYKGLNNRNVFVQARRKDHFIVIRDRRNRNVTGQTFIYEFIVLFDDGAGNNIFVDPRIRNIY